MSSINPKIFEGWIDPEGGNWIRIKSGTFEGIIWRPVDLDMDDDGKVSFQVEQFTGPGAVEMPAEGTHDATRFETVCGNCIKDIITEAAAQDAALSSQDDPR